MAEQPQEDWQSFDPHKRLVKARLLAANTLQQQVTSGSKCMLGFIFVAVILLSLLFGGAFLVSCGNQIPTLHTSSLVVIQGSVKEQCCGELLSVMWPTVLGFVGLALSGAAVVVSGHITLHRLLRDE